MLFIVHEQRGHLLHKRLSMNKSDKRRLERLNSKVHRHTTSINDTPEVLISLVIIQFLRSELIKVLKVLLSLIVLNF